MAKKARYSFPTTYYMKREHMEMIKSYEVRDVSSNRTKDGKYNVFFSVKKSKEAKIVEHFTEAGIKLTKV